MAASEIPYDIKSQCFLPSPARPVGCSPGLVPDSSSSVEAWSKACRRGLPLAVGERRAIHRRPPNTRTDRRDGVPGGYTYARTPD